MGGATADSWNLEIDTEKKLNVTNWEVFLLPAQCKELLQASIFILGLYREVLVLVIFPVVSTDTWKKKALLGFTVHFEKIWQKSVTQNLTEEQQA